MLQKVLHYLIVIFLTTIVGAIIGGVIGGISFPAAGGYTVGFGIDQGFPFGMLCGFAWGVFFGWIVLKYGYLVSSIAAGLTFAFALGPAILGSPPFAWLAGMLGSFAALPLIFGIGEWHVGAK
ncbi:hypothetical protein LLG95_14680 [bacterium]|nr:hypothetical protein [bacterium]